MKKIFTLLLAVIALSASAQKTPNLALTPPMGWNSWNKFGCDVSEKLIKDMADVMVNSGMKDAGYQYIVIDDCWQISRDDKGNIIADPERFPSGIKALADYIHSKGLKFGIYSCAGTKTCAGRPGGWDHEILDANQYAAWGVDYLKYDWCSHEGIDPLVAYTRMSKALAASGRPIVFSLCEWGSNRPWAWAKDIGHLWRSTGDIQDCYDCKRDWGGKGWVLILDEQEGLEKYAGPDHWNDPDMLEVGNKGLKPHESAAHFSFWCLLASPLMAGNDISTMNDTTKNILTNKDAIAVNQDALGIQGSKKLDDGDFEIWTKPLKNGDIAVILFNRGEFEYSYQPDWKLVGINGNFKLYDIWQHKETGNTASAQVLKVSSHSVLFYRLVK
jgi:alpha-galactosidase